MLRLECIAAARRSVHKQFGWKCPHPSTYRYFDALHESISCATTLFRHTAALLEKLFSRSRLCDWLGVLTMRYTKIITCTAVRCSGTPRPSRLFYAFQDEIWLVDLGIEE